MTPVGFAQDTPALKRRTDALRAVLVGVRKLANDFETASGEHPLDPDLEALLRLTAAEAARRYEAVSGRSPWSV